MIRSHRRPLAAEKRSLLLRPLGTGDRSLPWSIREFWLIRSSIALTLALRIVGSPRRRAGLAGLREVRRFAVVGHTSIGTCR